MEHRRKSLLFGIVLFMFALGVGMTSHVNASQAREIKGNGLNGIYIDLNSRPYTDGHFNYNNLVFTDRGCTCFAAARIYQLTGKYVTVYSGKAWYNSKYAKYGFTRGQQVRAKALACYEGHVAVVEQVNGSTVTVSEGGYRSAGKAAGYCYLHTMSVASLQSARNGKFLGYVYLDGSPDDTSTQNKVSVSFSNLGVRNVTENNAVPYATVSYSGAKPSSVGVCVSEDAGSLLRVASDPVRHNKNPFEIWYDLNKEASMTLKPQTNYFYKFYAVVNGQEYYSEVKSFTSGGTAAVPVVTPAVTPTVRFSDLRVENITSTNAQPKCTVSYSGSRPASVGVCVSTDPDHLTRSASDAIKHNKNPFDVWYNLNTEAGMVLSPNTTYYYKFYAVKDGAEQYSEVKSFVTK